VCSALANVKTGLQILLDIRILQREILVYLQLYASLPFTNAEVRDNVFAQPASGRANVFHRIIKPSTAIVPFRPHVS
jgi:hypothetical protein